MEAERAARCPLCSQPVEMPRMYCATCDLQLQACPNCGRLHPPWLDKCPYCGSTVNTSRKLETAQLDDALPGGTDNASAAGRIERLETGAEAPADTKPTDTFAADAELETPNTYVDYYSNGGIIGLIRYTARVPLYALIGLAVFVSSYFDENANSSMPVVMVITLVVIGVLSAAWLMAAWYFTTGLNDD
jgi:hypothetical protein